ncbi:MAG: HD domain-containing protein [Phycisphaerales bacterium]|nr:HD domain-containing protein [Phycisphaerales bacterium]
MPILTNVDDLTTRMRLHDDVYAAGDLLLHAGKELNAADVDYLRKRCPNASVSIEDPVLDSLIAFEDDSADRAVAFRTQKQLCHLLQNVHETFGPRMTVRSLDCRGVQQAVAGTLDYLNNNPVMAMTLIQQPGPDQHCLVDHSAHVFYLSLVMGNTVRSRITEARRKDRNKRFLQPAADINLTPLALAALFMDLGMWPIRNLFEQKESLTVEQIQQIRNHPIVSARALPEDAGELTHLIVETHHENFDGTGYPYGLRGEEIHIYARMLRIADAFAAATAKRLYREAISPVRALWEMTWGPYHQFYDPILLKVFARLVQPFPIGAKVGLNDGRQAVVVNYGVKTPFLPEVVIAFDEHGARLPPDRLGKPMRLDEDSDVRIASFQGEDIGDLYDRDTQIATPTSGEFTTLFESVTTGCAMARPK